MTKHLNLPVRSLGSEVENPSLERLASWITDRHGQEGDLLTYKLEESLRCQEGIDIPAVGGRMYTSRFWEALPEPKEGHLLEELIFHPDQLVADATHMITLRKGLWFSIPAPHLLSARDPSERDSDERSSEVLSAYREVMRSMRDAGVQGHVLLCDRVIEEELEKLTGRRQLVYCETADRKSLSLLLEYQAIMVVPASRLDLVLTMKDEFDISQVILVNPDPGHLRSALREYDPDTIVVGGYCRKDCERYWTQICETAEVTLSSPQP